ncbi:MAG TPA: RidA family protein [Candidatus Baltobacteraceae bacterium]|jgi:enamine deaminase RidA (YjgF/YER057c/UK114 family)|nr:RidA family protein [Candidatus Baltobacteraceae bacterium]
MSRIIQPGGWKRPRGYSNGVAARGEQIFVAGQIGWNEREEFVSSDFAEQTAQALRNVVAVLAAAGAKPEHLVRMTWYVTDKHEYSASSKRVGELYREIIGEVYPAMTLVQVAALLEDGAKVEIEATAVVPE